jgi:hypothetical protein
MTVDGLQGKTLIGLLPITITAIEAKKLGISHHQDLVRENDTRTEIETTTLTETETDLGI